MAIAGATNQSYTPVANGEYAVAVTLGSCADTSACVFFYAVGTSELGITNEELGIYPNPTTGLFTLEINGIKSQESRIKIYDVLGNVILQSTINSKQSTINMSGVAKGIYFVEVYFDKLSMTCVVRKRIVKE